MQRRKERNDYIELGRIALRVLIRPQDIDERILRTSLVIHVAIAVAILWPTLSQKWQEPLASLVIFLSAAVTGAMFGGVVFVAARAWWKARYLRAIRKRDWQWKEKQHPSRYTDSAQFVRACEKRRRRHRRLAERRERALAFAGHGSLLVQLVYLAPAAVLVWSGIAIYGWLQS